MATATRQIGAWNLTYTHTEDGKWVSRLDMSFGSKKEALARQRELSREGENRDLRSRAELESNPKYRPW